MLGCFFLGGTDLALSMLAVASLLYVCFRCFVASHHLRSWMKECVSTKSMRYLSFFPTKHIGFNFIFPFLLFCWHLRFKHLAWHAALSSTVPMARWQEGCQPAIFKTLVIGMWRRQIIHNANPTKYKHIICRYKYMICHCVFRRYLFPMYKVRPYSLSS